MDEFLGRHSECHMTRQA